MSNFLNEKDALLGSFPYSLTRDTDKEQLADAIAAELIKTVIQTDYAAVFPRIDEQPEEVLDILAADLKIDWYEVDAPVWNKRQAVKDCILVHKYKGTKYAVETALRSMYNSAEVQEWFEYGGEPYHFQIKVYGSSGSGLKTLYLKILYAKNLRSVMDDIKFVLVPEKEIDVFFGVKLASLQKSLDSSFKSDREDMYTAENTNCAGISMSSRLKLYGSEFTYKDNSKFRAYAVGFISVSVVSIKKEYQPRYIDECTGYSYNSRGNYAISFRAARFVKKIGMEVKL